MQNIKPQNKHILYVDRSCVCIVFYISENILGWISGIATAQIDMVMHNAFPLQLVFLYLSAGFPTVTRKREAYQSIDQQADQSATSADNPFDQAQDNSPTPATRAY